MIQSNHDGMLIRYYVWHLRPWSIGRGLEDFVGGGFGNKNGFEYVEDDDIEPLDWDNEDDDYRSDHWDEIEDAKSQCVDEARESLSD